MLALMLLSRLLQYSELIKRDPAIHNNTTSLIPNNVLI